MATTTARRVETPTSTSVFGRASSMSAATDWFFLYEYPRLKWRTIPRQ